MAELKTKPTNESVEEFINAFAHTEQQRQDSFELVKIMKDVTGFEPKMWGTSIIGFGSYHYKSERSRQEGDWPLGESLVTWHLKEENGTTEVTLQHKGIENLADGGPDFAPENFRMGWMELMATLINHVQGK